MKLINKGVNVSNIDGTVGSSMEFNADKTTFIQQLGVLNKLNNSTNNSFSISFWTKLSKDTYPAFCSASTDSLRMEITFSSGTPSSLYFYTYNDVSISTIVNDRENTWFYVTVTYDPSNNLKKIYIA